MFSSLADIGRRTNAVKTRPENKIKLEKAKAKVMSNQFITDDDSQEEMEEEMGQTADRVSSLGSCDISVVRLILAQPT